MTSGTLAYSHGLGRPVVSTPYWHAAELLADGSGVLIPFDNPAGFGPAISDLLGNDTERLAMGRKAYAARRPMIWAHSARPDSASFHTASLQSRPPHPLPPGVPAPGPRP